MNGIFPSFFSEAIDSCDAEIIHKSLVDACNNNVSDSVGAPGAPGAPTRWIDTSHWQGPGCFINV